MKFMNAIWLSLAALWVASCYETNLDYDINADGSGRVVVEVRSASMMGQLGNLGTGDKAGPQTLARDIIKKASGIDTWKDIELKTLEDGKSYFKGTAYFKDITAVKFKEISMVDSIRLSTDAKKHLVLLIGGDPPSAKDGGSKNLSEGDLEKSIKDQRAGFNQMKPMLTAFMSTMKTTTTFRVSGKLDKSSNLKSEKGGRMSVSFDGQKFLDVLDKLMADDEWMKRQARAGANIKDKPPVGEEINQMLFGEKGPIRAVYKGPFNALFDYGTEADAARAGYDNMLKNLGVDLSEGSSGAAAEVPKEGYKGGDFQSVRIVRVSYSDMNDPEYRLFGDDRSYQLTFIGELPGAIMGVDKIVLTRAVADNGDDLMPSNEWNRETTWADLSKDKAHVKWSFTLNQPGPAVSGLSEVSGTMYCQVAGSTKTVDTGLHQWVVGSTGSELGTTIEDRIESEYQHDLKLKLAVDERAIREIRFYDDRGEALVPTSHYSSSYDGQSSWTFSFDRTLPASGSIKAEINDAIEYYQIPFTVSQVDLFGKPMK